MSGIFDEKLGCSITGDLPQTITDSRDIKLMLSIDFVDDASAVAFRALTERVGPAEMARRLQQIEKILTALPADQVCS